MSGVCQTRHPIVVSYISQNASCTTFKFVPIFDSSSQYLLITQQVLPSTLHVMGRIANVQVWDYIDKLKTSTTRVSAQTTHSEEHLNIIEFPNNLVPYCPHYAYGLYKMYCRRLWLSDLTGRLMIEMDMRVCSTTWSGSAAAVWLMSISMVSKISTWYLWWLISQYPINFYLSLVQVY